MKQWFLRRSIKSKVILVVVATFLGFSGVGAMTAPAQQKAAFNGAATVNNAASQAVDVSEKQKIAVTKTEVESVEEEIPFTTTTTYDGTLPKDTSVVRVEGHNGKKVVKTEVKTKDGVEVSRALISETVTVPPVNKIVAVGTKVMAKPKQPQQGSCHPSYSPCVKVVEGDLDCDDIGFTVVVIGTSDPYKLDGEDNDGIGCEKFSEQ